MTGLDPTTLTIIAGPDDHGVVRHARTVAGAVDSRVIRLPTIADIDEAAARGESVGRDSGRRVVHVHFTERLFGDDVAGGVGRFRALRRTITGPVVVTLHDVPFDDGTAHSARRRAAYREVLDLIDVAIVASRAERERVLALQGDVDVRVIPLPVVPADERQRAHRPRHVARRPGPPCVGILGFIYPGKGHAEVIEAAAILNGPVHVVALGRCSDGHGDMEHALRSLAAVRGTTFEVSGFLDDAELSTELARVDVPVVPAFRTSASASLQTWIAAERRPLVAANDYTIEVATMMPGAMDLYRADSPQDLADGLRRALDRPDDTWRDDPEVTGPASLEAVAEAHRCVFRSVLEVGVR